MIGSLERFQTLVENSPDAISLVNADGRVVYASASTAKVLGYQPEELLGQNGLDLIHPQDRDHSLKTLQDLVAEPESQNRLQTRVRQKNGQWLWVESTTSNLLNDPSVGAVVINYREIAARKAAEEERQRITEELTKANVELNAFAHIVAHDLREPLRTMGAFTELLVRKAKLEESDKEIADFVVTGMRCMSALLDDLLASAVSQSKPRARQVALEDVIAHALRNLKLTLASSGATVQVEPLPSVVANEFDLVRLFQNLISNAVKYRSKAPVQIHISAGRSGPDWIIRVRDNGIGIAKKDHRRVFTLFTRLHKDEIPGTGIGLAICERIVEGFGGAIWVESRRGSGSTFCFTVPAQTELGGSTAPASTNGLAQVHNV